MLALLTGSTLCPCCVLPLAAPRSRAGAAGFGASTRSGAGLACTAARPSVWNDPVPRVDLAIEHATIVDTIDGTLIEDATILVAQGRIIAIEQRGTPGAEGAGERVDATGKFVVPGYNDMHSHVLNLDDPSGALALMLADGVTGYRQMSGSPERLRERQEMMLPECIEAPALLEMPGAVLTPLNASTVEGVLAEIRAQKAQGADFIKVGFVSPPVFLAAMKEAKRLAIPILGHLQDGVDAAFCAQAGFRSIEHLGPGAAIWEACSTEQAQLKSTAKPVSIPSLLLKIPFLRKMIIRRLETMLVNPSAFMPPAYAARLQRAIDTFSQEKFAALAARFAAEDTWHCPTLVRLRTQELADAPQYETHPFLAYMPQDRIATWRKVTDRFRKLPVEMREIYAQAYPRQLALMKSLADAGVRMIAGTDGGWLSNPGLSLQEEFAELARAGISPLKILQMTTINAAEYLNRTETMGTVAVGRNADLVLLNTNPLQDVASLGDIASVVRAGFHRSRAALDALRARVAATRGTLHEGKTLATRTGFT